MAATEREDARAPSDRGAGGSNRWVGGARRGFVREGETKGNKDMETNLEKWRQGGPETSGKGQGNRLRAWVGAAAAGEFQGHSPATPSRSAGGKPQGALRS